MARNNPRMEYRILCMLANTLILYTWASCSVTAQNITISPLNEFYDYPANLKIKYPSFAQDCWDHYSTMMSKLEPEMFCEWQKINRPYSFLRFCLEDLADAFNYTFPNEIAHEYIMKGHRTYFVNCTLLFQELVDPPEHVLFALIFAPISIIPFLVTLVVCKSITSEPQA
ncbi:receptor activity-modifying protein 2 [Spea bombifrons]|uniref:receptor activity-modifying protein 2 n=1 Tax=Spea bombifrons TaxID=233779 RepID=UPI0023496E8C|nr:receptor activity-modifying protein 2 [Spea bombifrons]